jgi:hypothetical protein
MPAEMFLGVFPSPGRIRDYPRMIERDGWDGLTVTESKPTTATRFVP